MGLYCIMYTETMVDKCLTSTHLLSLTWDSDSVDIGFLNQFKTSQNL